MTELIVVDFKGAQRAGHSDQPTGKVGAAFGVAQQLEADFRAVETRMDVFEADAQARNAVEEEFRVAVERLSERFVVWSGVLNEHLNAQLDEADVRLREWKTKAQSARTEQEIQRWDALATLEDRIARAKAQLAAWNRDRHAEGGRAGINSSCHDREHAIRNPVT